MVLFYIIFLEMTSWSLKQTINFLVWGLKYRTTTPANREIKILNKTNKNLENNNNSHNENIAFFNAESLSDFANVSNDIHAWCNPFSINCADVVNAADDNFATNEWIFVTSIQE